MTKDACEYVGGEWIPTWPGEDGIGDEPQNSYYDPADGLLIDNKYHDTIEENLEAFFYLIQTASGENVSGLENIYFYLFDLLKISLF